MIVKIAMAETFILYTRNELASLAHSFQGFIQRGGGGWPWDLPIPSPPPEFPSCQVISGHLTTPTIIV